MVKRPHFRFGGRLGVVLGVVFLGAFDCANSRVVLGVVFFCFFEYSIPRVVWGGRLGSVVSFSSENPGIGLIVHFALLKTIRIFANWRRSSAWPGTLALEIIERGWLRPRLAGNSGSRIFANR